MVDGHSSERVLWLGGDALHHEPTAFDFHWKIVLAQRDIRGGRRPKANPAVAAIPKKNEGIKQKRGADRTERNKRPKQGKSEGRKKTETNKNKNKKRIRANRLRLSRIAPSVQSADRVAASIGRLLEWISSHRPSRIDTEPNRTGLIRRQPSPASSLLWLRLQCRRINVQYRFVFFLHFFLGFLCVEEDVFHLVPAAPLFRSLNRFWAALYEFSLVSIFFLFSFYCSRGRVKLIRTGYTNDPLISPWQDMQPLVFNRGFQQNKTTNRMFH